MSARLRAAVSKLNESIRENSARVERKLAKAGTTPNPAIVFTVAKYYKVLNKLAKE